MCRRFTEISKGNVRLTTYSPSPSILTDIDCLLIIKTNLLKVSNFIGSFLLQPINGPSFILDVQCPLYLFIQEQIREHGTITSMINRNETFVFVLLNQSVRMMILVHGIFDLELESHDNKVPFPKKWCLAQDVKIHCRIENCNSKEKTMYIKS